MRADIESLRLPPHSVEAEQAVLGGLLTSNAALDRIADILNERDFYRADHRAIWRHVIRLIEDNKPADVLTILEALKDAGELADVGGFKYVHELISGSHGAANIRHYAGIVRDRAKLRALIEAATIIQDEAYRPGVKNVAEIVDAAQAKLLEATTSRGGVGARRISELLGEVMTNLDEMHRNPKSVTGKATGFVDLDEMTAGLQDGDLIVIAGRPSMGKTALAMNIVEHVAVELKLPVQVFSMEMGGNQIASRLLGSLAQVDASKMRTGRLDAPDWDRLGPAIGKLNDAPIFIDETPALTPLELRAAARRRAREYGGLGLVVVDYLQLMETGNRNDNRAAEVAEISRSMKTMAKELRCPVLLLSQLNRSLEARTNKRPVMSDLRESGAIEQDADVIIFIYRDEVYYEDSPDKGLAEIILGKQRNGPLGTVRLTWLGKHTRFANYSGAIDSFATNARRHPRKSFRAD
jgi:replicative DNA helicase